jgi:hypothetical protein
LLAQLGSAASQIVRAAQQVVGQPLQLAVLAQGGQQSLLRITDPLVATHPLEHAREIAQ